MTTDTQHSLPEGDLRHPDLISRMTLEEKASLTSGANFWDTKAIDRLGIPSVSVSDGPHGLRKQTASADHLGLNASVPATSFPTAATLASSWEVDVLASVGEAVAREAAVEDVQAILGPGLNIKRNPLGGRNFEYFSEDPYLAGRLSAAFILGAQSAGVSACPKHFAVNSQETYRMSIDEVVDERALREIYLEGFRIAVAEGHPWLIMTSYNKVNGTYAHENPHLVDTILRGEWEYDGAVVSDWGGNNDGARAAAAGSNLEMPSSLGITDARIVQAVQSGELDEAILDRRVDEFLTFVDRVSADADRIVVDFDRQHDLAAHAAERSLVLLTNERGTLPLRRTDRIAVIGDFADTPRYQGAGSSLVNPTRVVSALEALHDTNLTIIGFEPGFKRQDSPSPKLARRALDLAGRADTVLLFLGLDEGAECEGVDRAHMHLAKNQLALTRELIGTGARIVVVLAGGAPIELPFADHVDAILHAYLPGQAGGTAIASILTGAVSPSGKLAESYPYRYGDVASAADYTAHEASAEHRESIYVGYRYYDKVGAPVRYPFGHGLSYTTFGYSEAEVQADEAGSPIAVRVTVTNTGAVRGAETVQVYVQSADAFRPLRELRGFGKVDLDPGQSKQVTVDLSDHAFSVFDVGADRWTQVAGTYEIQVAASSRDIRQRLTVEVAGEAAQLNPPHLPHYASGDTPNASDAEFERLLGRVAPRRDWDQGAPLTAESIVAELPGHSLAANAVHGVITSAAFILDKVHQPTLANYARFLLALPLRSLSRMSSGLITEPMQNKIIAVLNGKECPWHLGKK